MQKKPSLWVQPYILQKNPCCQQKFYISFLSLPYQEITWVRATMFSILYHKIIHFSLCSKSVETPESRFFSTASASISSATPEAAADPPSPFAKDPERRIKEIWWRNRPFCGQFSNVDNNFPNKKLAFLAHIYFDEVLSVPRTLWDVNNVNKKYFLWIPTYAWTETESTRRGARTNEESVLRLSVPEIGGGGKGGGLAWVASVFPDIRRSLVDLERVHNTAQLTVPLSYRNWFLCLSCITIHTCRSRKSLSSNGIKMLLASLSKCGCRHFVRSAVLTGNVANLANGVRCISVSSRLRWAEKVRETL